MSKRQFLKENFIFKFLIGMYYIRSYKGHIFKEETEQTIKKRVILQSDPIPAVHIHGLWLVTYSRDSEVMRYVEAKPVKRTKRDTQARCIHACKCKQRLADENKTYRLFYTLGVYFVRLNI